MKLSIVVVDSRSDAHPDWVGGCLSSLQNQIVPCEIVVVNNVGRKKSIGKCFNQGAEEATGDWVVFVGDDDYVAYDYTRILLDFINDPRVQKSRTVNIATYMTAFNDETGQKTALARQSTGAWKRDYLLEHPFNEGLEKGIDREYIEEAVKRGDLITVIEYYFGYFYRRHSDYRCAGDIVFEKDHADYYFVTTNRIFLHPITERFSKSGKVFVDNRLTPELARNAKFIWCEWGNEKAIDIANFETDVPKILRIHAYEAFSQTMKELDLNAFDVVIFIDDYIKDFVERQYGKVKGAVVIPNGVELDKFTFNPKPKNNKIAYAGYLTRKKGIGELLLLAKSLPDYEFHLAGKYQEDDIADWMNEKKPDNVFVHPWQYDINTWLQDKSFILNTSMRESQAMTLMEGMACGLKPLVNDWIGAKEIYGEEFVYSNLWQLRDLLEGEHEPERYREFIEDGYNYDEMFEKIADIIDMKVGK